MEKITAYKISDGRLFENEEVAKTHQADLDMEKRVKKLVDVHFFSGMYSETITEVIIDLIENGMLSIHNIE